MKSRKEFTQEDHTAFLKAARDGDIETVENYLNKGIDVNSENNDGVTALYRATWGGHKEIAKLLLERGANPNIKTKPGEHTPLLVAAQEGHVKIVSLLIKHGANANIVSKITRKYTAAQIAQDKGHKECEALIRKAMYAQKNHEFSQENVDALIEAAANDKIDEVRDLLNHGIAIDAKGKYSSSALYYAAKQGRDDIVQLLLEHGANIEIRGDYNNTPLIVAAVYGKNRTISTLLKHNADVFAEDKFGRSPIYYHHNHKPLRIATIEKLFEKLDGFKGDKEQFEKEFNPLAKFKEHVLQHIEDLDLNKKLELLYNATQNESDPLYKYFHLQRGKNPVCENAGCYAKVIAAYSAAKKECRYALLEACKSGDLESFKKHVKHFTTAELDTVWLIGNPLHIAATHEHPDIIAYLLNEKKINANGVGCNTINKMSAKAEWWKNTFVGPAKDLKSALYYAVKHNQIDAAKVLVEHGAEATVEILKLVNEGDNGMISLLKTQLLQIIVKNKYFEGFKAITDYFTSKELDAVIINNTPLLWHLTLNNQRDMVKYLLEIKKCNPDVTKKDNQSTPLNVAAELGNINIIQDLLKHGADINAICSDKRGDWTPMLLAVDKARTNTVKFLLDNGAIVDKNVFFENKNIFQIAEEIGNQEVIDLLNNAKKQTVNPQVEKPSLYPQLEPIGEDVVVTARVPEEAPPSYEEAVQEKIERLQYENALLNQQVLYLSQRNTVPTLFNPQTVPSAPRMTVEEEKEFSSSSNSEVSSEGYATNSNERQPAYNPEFSQQEPAAPASMFWPKVPTHEPEMPMSKPPAQLVKATKQMGYAE